MKEQDLMIGDWVMIPGEVNRVIQIRSGFNICNAGNFQPIRITDEILINAGFVQNEDIPSWFNMTVFTDKYDEDGDLIKDYSITINKTNTAYWVYILKNTNLSSLKYYCNYIHEIQHGLNVADINATMFNEDILSICVKNC